MLLLHLHVSLSNVKIQFHVGGLSPGSPWGWLSAKSGRQLYPGTSLWLSVRVLQWSPSCTGAQEPRRLSPASTSACWGFRSVSPCLGFLLISHNPRPTTSSSFPSFLWHNPWLSFGVPCCLIPWGCSGSHPSLLLTMTLLGQSSVPNSPPSISDAWVERWTSDLFANTLW